MQFTKKYDLGQWDDNVKGSYIKFKMVNTKDAQVYTSKVYELVDDTEKKKISESDAQKKLNKYNVELLKNHFVSGEYKEGDKNPVDMSVDDIEQLPFLIVEDIVKVLKGKLGKANS